MQIPVTTSGRIHPYHPIMRPRLFFRRKSLSNSAAVFFVLALNLSAQEAAILTNSGEPIRLAYSCAEEDLQWAGMSCTDDQPCAIFLELSSVVPVGKKIVLA